MNFVFLPPCLHMLMFMCLWIFIVIEFACFQINFACISSGNMRLPQTLLCSFYILFSHLSHLYSMIVMKIWCALLFLVIFDSFVEMCKVHRLKVPSVWLNAFPFICGGAGSLFYASYVSASSLFHMNSWFPISLEMYFVYLYSFGIYVMHVRVYRCCCDLFLPKVSICIMNYVLPSNCIWFGWC